VKTTVVKKTVPDEEEENRHMIGFGMENKGPALAAEC